MRVVVHIERLVLEGLDLSPRQRLQLGAALSAELSRLIEAGGLHGELRAGLAMPRLDAGTLRLDPTCDSRALGEQLAQALYTNGLGDAPGREERR